MFYLLTYLRVKSRQNMARSFEVTGNFLTTKIRK